MSLYNMLFGINNLATILLKILQLDASIIPRFRDCFILNNTICIHTRTGGGNRDFYENENSAKDNYDEEYDGPYNSDLRDHPNYLTDYDDKFDCTYANFIFSFPEEYKNELQAIADKNNELIPSEKWKSLFEKMEVDNEEK